MSAVAERRTADRLIELVDAYARRANGAAAQQPSGRVWCPLGVWLLLAACAVTAAGEQREALQQREALERALGCEAEEGAALLAAFLAEPHEALATAIALWVQAAHAGDAVAAWARRLPSQVETGFMPTQAEADAWAQRATLGLIRRFPLRIDPRVLLVLTSAVATRVSWPKPFALADAARELDPSSPWHDSVRRLLLVVTN